MRDFRLIFEGDLSSFAMRLYPLIVSNNQAQPERSNIMQAKNVGRLLVFTAFALCQLLADSGPNHQTKQSPPIQLGATGGNVNDSSRRFCCGGTLGALVSKNGIDYVLSNNHVLARTDAAQTGEDVIHPGLIDVNCNGSESIVIGDLSEFVLLGTGNVDAAIAQARAGRVSAQILDVGFINPEPAPATPGMPVMKSGRTTGQTFGRVEAINVDVLVRYQARCGSGKKFDILYNDQITISPGVFSAGGDSGSTILSNDRASCTRPVGLLFAGSSTVTIANSIGDVMAALGVQFVGGRPTFHCTGTGPTSSGISPPQAALDVGRRVKNNHKARILAIEGIVGMGVGTAEDNPAEPVIVVYSQEERTSLPTILDGLHVKVIRTEPFEAYGNQKWGDSSCGK
jgi:hypothetical protein